MVRQFCDRCAKQIRYTKDVTKVTSSSGRVWELCPDCSGLADQPGATIQETRMVVFLTVDPEKDGLFRTWLNERGVHAFEAWLDNRYHPEEWVPEFTEADADMLKTFCISLADCPH